MPANQKLLLLSLLPLTPRPQRLLHVAPHRSAFCRPAPSVSKCTCSKHRVRLRQHDWQRRRPLVVGQSKEPGLSVFSVSLPLREKDFLLIRRLPSGFHCSPGNTPCALSNSRSLSPPRPITAAAPDSALSTTVPSALLTWCEQTLSSHLLPPLSVLLTLNRLFHSFFFFLSVIEYKFFLLHSANTPTDRHTHPSSQDFIFERAATINQPRGELPRQPGPR